MNSKSVLRLIMTAMLLATVMIFSVATARAQTETILHNFSGAGGAYPQAGLLLDAAGDLYGTTFTGGNPNYCQPYGCGVAFQLSAAHGSWQETVIRDFPNSAGGSFAGLISDSAGNLYGVTLDGGGSTACTNNGSVGCGTVFELSPATTGQWTRTVLHAFTGGADGGLPLGGLAFDTAGNLYGTTTSGG